MPEAQVIAEMPAHATFPVRANVEVAVFVAQLVVCEKIGSALLDDFPEEKIRVHVALDLQGGPLLGILAVAQGRVQGGLLGGGGARAGLGRVEDVGRETTFVASDFDCRCQSGPYLPSRNIIGYSPRRGLYCIIRDHQTLEPSWTNSYPPNCQDLIPPHRSN